MVKVRSSLQTKIMASFILLVLVVSGLTFVYTFGKTKQALQEILRDELRALASTVATQIDGDSLASLTVGAESTANFIRIRDQLLAIQRAHPDIKSVYTFTRTASDPRKIQFLVDAEYGLTDSLAGPPSIGDVYDEATALMLAALVAPAVETDFGSDQWGTFLSGYAPIRNRAGVVVGAVGIEMLSTRVLHEQAFIGTTIYVVAIAILLAGTIIVLFSMTASYRKRAEQELHQAEERMELLFSESLDGFFFMVLDEPVHWNDTVDKEKVLDYVVAHLRATKVNDAMLAQYGATREQFSGLTPNDFFAHDTVYGRRIMRELFDAGRLHVDTDERKLDGTKMWVEGDYVCLYDSQGRITGHFGIQRDITERVRAEEALKNSLSLVEATLESTDNGILVISPEGTVVKANGRFAEMWRIPEDVLASGEDQRLLDHVLGQLSDPDAFVAKVKALYGDPRAESADLLYFKDGRVFERNSKPMLVGGEPKARVWSFLDITDRKRAEAEKAELEARNRQLQKAESLSRMAGAIAHHFNNQLQAVLLNLELAKGDLLQDAGPARSVTEAMMAVNQAAEMSKLMLTYLGQSRGVREPLDLSVACSRWLSPLRGALPKHVVLETDLASPGPTIRADADQMRQVLTHLVTNAWEAGGPSRGEIRVTVKAVTSAAVPLAHCVPPDWQPLEPASACLEVVDHGCGIAEADIEKVFDPFYSSKFTGRGLGLAVVLGIVRAHGGAVTVESTPGSGSAFRVYLPVSEEGVPVRS